MLYFLLHDADAFRSIAAVLATSWHQRTFAPITGLATELAPTLDTFAERFHLTADEEPLLRRVSAHQRFDRRLWRHLAGEVLLYAAADVPVLQTAPETLACLLASEDSSPIRQAHFGSRDLDFGGVIYRPDRAWWNDIADVARLVEYLTAVDPARWTAADLRPLSDFADDEEREEELAFARDCFAGLRAMYEQAHRHGQVVVCEEI